MFNVYTLEQSENWDAAVRSFHNYDVYWLSGYVKAFKIHGDGEPLLFFYEDKCARGINVVMKRDISHDCRFLGILEEGKYFDFSTPYGYGGWIVEGENPENMFAQYEKWCFENSIISEFVRFHPVLENHLYSNNFYDIVPLGFTVTLDVSSPEAIWENITSKNRNVIRKAQKNEIKIYNGRYPEIYETFRDIYNSTMDKDEADTYYYFSPAFYESVCNDLSQNAQVFYATLDNKVIAAAIMLTANGRMNYHLSGSIREYSNLAPSNLLLYKAALWAYANGCKTLYLGGGLGSGEDSLFKFKKSFYRLDDLHRFHIGKRVYNNDIYQKLIQLRSRESVFDENSAFFPLYRS